MLQIIIIVLALAADQLSKCLMEQLFTMPGESIEVIPGVFNLTYVQNKGASFGILQDRQAFFIVITFAVLIAATWAMIKYRKTHKRFLKVSIALAYAGAIGNLIDRIQFGYVRDFIDIRVFGDLWKWIFNVADMCARWWAPSCWAFTYCLYTRINLRTRRVAKQSRAKWMSRKTAQQNRIIRPGWKSPQRKGTSRTGRNDCGQAA